MRLVPPALFGVAAFLGASACGGPGSEPGPGPQIADAGTPQTPEAGPPYPRLANIYLHGAVAGGAPESLARWDLVILNTVWSHAELAELRGGNPAIRIFPYVCAYCLPDAAPPADDWVAGLFGYAEANDL